MDTRFVNGQQQVGFGQPPMNTQPAFGVNYPLAPPGGGWSSDHQPPPPGPGANMPYASHGQPLQPARGSEPHGMSQMPPQLYKAGASVQNGAAPGMFPPSQQPPQPHGALPPQQPPHPHGALPPQQPPHPHGAAQGWNQRPPGPNSELSNQMNGMTISGNSGGGQWMGPSQPVQGGPSGPRGQEFSPPPSQSGPPSGPPQAFMPGNPPSLQPGQQGMPPRPPPSGYGPPPGPRGMPPPPSQTAPSGMTPGPPPSMQPGSVPGMPPGPPMRQPGPPPTTQQTGPPPPSGQFQPGAYAPPADSAPHLQPAGGPPPLMMNAGHPSQPPISGPPPMQPGFRGSAPGSLPPPPSMGAGPPQMGGFTSSQPSIGSRLPSMMPSSQPPAANGQPPSSMGYSNISGPPLGQPPLAPMNMGPQHQLSMGIGSPTSDLQNTNFGGPGMQPGMGQPPGGQMIGQRATPLQPLAGAGSYPPPGQQQQQPPGMTGYPGVQQQQQPGMGGSYPPAAQQPKLMNPASSGPQQPARKLDPDQMPSPIQVMEDDRRNRGGLFQTGQRGAVPPLVTTSYIAEDQGTCSPRFLRSTMYNIPCTADLLKQSHLTFAISITPFARLHPKETPPPIVDLGLMGPVRCNRCKAYICPYMSFTDGGRKFQCSFCSCSTEVPPEYFAHLDHTGRRVDCYDRPELCLGAYEFVATSDYCKDNKLPNAPAYIFMIDVSYNSVKSGLLDLLCTRLKDDVLRCLPKDVGAEESEIRVGFVTYAKELHFYNIKGTLAQPQMLVVTDVHDVFMPLLDGFFVKVSEAEAIIDSLLVQISQVFSESRETETVLGPVIQAGLDALKAAERAGKLIIFHSSLPTADAPGKLVNRDDRKLLGTDKEKTILTPQNNFYTKLGQECVAAGCSVDLYVFPNSYIDVATISEVPRLTGGSLYKYMYFQSDLDGDNLISDLIMNISRPVAFDAVIRVRTSTGIRAVDFYGNLYMSNTTDIELACINPDKSIAVEIKHDDKLVEAEGAYVQAAILYTSVGGQRRLRVLNAAFNCCTQIADMFRNCELDMLVNYMAKQAIRESVNSNSKQVRDNLMNQCAQILACYRKNCASPSSSGQLILPECMKLLPVYSNCIIKSSILQSLDINTDDRMYAMHLVNAMGVNETNVYFYPRLLPLHEVDVAATALPTPLRCSYERLRDNGVYLLENGMVMFMWVGLGVNPEWVRNVFNVPSAAQIDIDRTRLQDLENPLSSRIRQIVKRVREERHRHMKLIVVRQRDKLEPVFQQYLVEDRGANGSSSYVDFLCHIHKEIRNLLN